jgi:hypothetical protein
MQVSRANMTNETGDQRQNQQARLPERAQLTIRLLATLFGVLAGVACFILLDQFTAIGTTLAFVLGLVFALLTRVAAASLARDWLVRAASRR